MYFIFINQIYSMKLILVNLTNKIELLQSQALAVRGLSGSHIM